MKCTRCGGWMGVERYFEGREASCRVCGHVEYLDGAERDLGALSAEVEEKAKVYHARGLLAAEGKRRRRLVEEVERESEVGRQARASLSGHGTANRSLMCGCEACAAALEHLRARRREATQRFRARQAVPA